MYLESLNISLSNLSPLISVGGMIRPLPFVFGLPGFVFVVLDQHSVTFQVHLLSSSLLELPAISIFI